jgi:cobalamin-dependent methionine synthase I
VDNLIIGELINTSRQAINTAVRNRDSAFIRELALKQAEAGADYIDINCGTYVNNEVEIMEWLVGEVQSVISVPLCIDSPDPNVLKAGLRMCRNGQPMVNSISAERDRYKGVLPLILEYEAKVVALCMDDTGMPQTAQDRLRVANRLVISITAFGIPIGDIYLDPLVKPISTSDLAGMEVLESIRLIKREFPEVNFACGLSNISFGLPNRKTLNRVFMIQATVVGMDSYILDPLDQEMMGAFFAAQALLGKDEYCSNYLAAYRSGVYSK